MSMSEERKQDNENTSEEQTADEQELDQDANENAVADTDDFTEPEENSEQDEPVDPFNKIQKKKAATKPTKLKEEASAKTKKGSKISPKIFLIGCGFFFLIFLGLVYAGLYFAVTSTEYLQAIGLEIEAVKNILIIFAVLFFGLIFFGGFYALVYNIYKVATTKGKKLKFIGGIVLGVVIIGLATVFGTLSITRIRALTGPAEIQTNQLVLPYIVTKDSAVRVNEGIPVIAPLKMRYQLNKTQFDRNVMPAINNNQVNSFTLDCGNGYQLEGTREIYLATNSFFPEHCLYLEKGTYPISLTVEYFDRQSNEEQSQTFKMYDLTIGAEIGIEGLNDTSYYNDRGTEYILGISPVTAQFRGQLLFTDLGLDQDRIEWDMDDDGQVDIEDNASFDYPFNDPKLHTINYRLPGLGTQFRNTWLSFDLRVVESELASCTIDIEEIDERTFKFSPSFDELVNAAQYTYIITDPRLDTIVDKIDVNRDSTTYTFQEGGDYEVSMMYFTPDKQKGSCDTEPLTVGLGSSQVEFDLRFKQDSSAPFVAVGEDTKVTHDQVNSQINVNMLPAILEVTVTDIFPDPDADLSVYYDGRQLFAERADVYEINIGSLGQKELEFVTETEQGTTNTQTYTIDVARGSVRAALVADPLTGSDPLEVELDASISSLYDEEDEIVYFTWDFGDGETLQNVSQGTVTHTYTYDNENEDGTYYPSVKVQTRKGIEDEVQLQEPIVVKKQQREVAIRSDSHPTQQARVGEVVNFSLETDGYINHIDWNFGNQETVGCDDRSCSTVSVTYDEPGEYVVRVEVQYENDSPAIEDMRFRIFE